MHGYECCDLGETSRFTVKTDMLPRQGSVAIMHSPPDASLYAVCRWMQRLRKQRNHLSLPLRVSS